MRSPDTREVLRAAAFAAEMHGGQLRKYSDMPYITHPLRVAYAAERHGLSPDAVVAALLHDVIEDTPTGRVRIAEQGFSVRAVTLVLILTKPWERQDHGARSPLLAEEPLLATHYRLIAQDPEAAALKLLDRTDNLRDLWTLVQRAPRSGPIRNWAEGYHAKSIRDVSPLIAAATRGVASAGAIFSEYKDALDALQARLRETTPGSPASTG